MALKVLDIFSVHGFPVGLIHAEANFIGVVNPVTGKAVGSGGWNNIIDKFEKAKRYCEAPFEIRPKASERIAIQASGSENSATEHIRQNPGSVNICCEDAAQAKHSRT